MSLDTQRIVEENLDILSRDFKGYDELDTLFRRARSLRKHVSAMYTWMKEHPVAYVHQGDDEEYWTMPVGWLKSQYGGALEAWQSHIILTLLLGLIRRVRPTNKSFTPEIRKAYAVAVQKRQRGMSFFKPVEFNEGTLRHANEEAKRILESKMSLSHIKKTDIIRHYGQKMANDLYVDWRQETTEEQYVRKKMMNTLKAFVDKNGFATPDQVSKSVKRDIWKKCDNDQEKAKPILRFVDKFMERKRDLCSMCGCTYRPQRREDKEKFGLKDNGWIIVKVQ